MRSDGIKRRDAKAQRRKNYKESRKAGESLILSGDGRDFLRSWPPYGDRILRVSASLRFIPEFTLCIKKSATLPLHPLVAIFLTFSLSHFCTAAEAPSLDKFHLPPGFVIERVAGPPQIQYGMCAASDERGRLFVTESSGSNDPGPKLVENPRCRVRMLEDSDGDGIFETSYVFA